MATKVEMHRYDLTVSNPPTESCKTCWQSQLGYCRTLRAAQQGVVFSAEIPLVSGKEPSSPSEAFFDCRATLGGTFIKMGVYNLLGPQEYTLKQVASGGPVHPLKCTEGHYATVISTPVK